MIGSLEDAWQWYQSARTLARSMQRLGKKHWDHLPWDGDLGRDEELRSLEGKEILDHSFAVLKDLDDLCVLLLLSVFEALVRARVRKEVAAELDQPRHPALQHALRTLNENLEHGSFFRILEVYKGWDPNLIEEVNQVRQYRNGVAHGRPGGAPANAVDPPAAYDRLQRFLARLFAPPEAASQTDSLPR
jgi:hypothetical protein